MIDTEKFARATIVSRRDLAADLWVLRLLPEVALPFRPGQYVTVGMQLNGRIVERPYSIVSDPADETIELFIERVPDGELSAPLFDLGEGAELIVRRRCKGLFLKEAPVEGQPHLLAATVTGIAPFVSIVRTLKRRADSGEWTPDHPVTVIQSASRASELGYADELNDLASRLDWLTYVPTVSRPWENPEWTGETGRAEDVLRKYADAAGIRPGLGVVFLCGHPEMIHASRAIMHRSGLEDSSIREEQYWPE